MLGGGGKRNLEQRGQPAHRGVAVALEVGHQGQPSPVGQCLQNAFILRHTFTLASFSNLGKLENGKLGNGNLGKMSFSPAAGTKISCVTRLLGLLYGSYKNHNLVKLLAWQHSLNSGARH